MLQKELKIELIFCLNNVKQQNTSKFCICKTITIGYNKCSNVPQTLTKTKKMIKRKFVTIT